VSIDDTALHAAIHDAHAAGRVAIDVNFRAVNRTGAPGFRTTDIVVPWFVGVAVSLYVGVAYGIVAGVALFVVLAGGIVVALRPFNRKRAEERNRQMGLATLEHWEALWRMGGVALRRLDGERPAAVSPQDDWRDFARALAPARQEAS
jgi:hypothetical protein